MHTEYILFGMPICSQLSNLLNLWLPSYKNTGFTTIWLAQLRDDFSELLPLQRRLSCFTKLTRFY